MTRGRILFVFVLALGAASCSIGDGRFRARGLVVGPDGKAMSNVTVKARNNSAVTGQDGCFEISETTYPGKHEMPFSVSAVGFKPYAGTVTVVPPGNLLLHVTLADAMSISGTVVDSSPRPGSLGACEAKSTVTK